MSVAESATMFVWPETAIVLNASVTEPVAVDVIVRVSVPGVVVNWIPEPAANVSVSVAASATIFVWPLTAIFLNASVTVPPPLDIVLNDKLPEPSVTRAWPLVPSLVG